MRFWFLVFYVVITLCMSNNVFASSLCDNVDVNGIFKLIDSRPVLELTLINNNRQAVGIDRNALHRNRLTLLLVRMGLFAQVESESRLVDDAFVVFDEVREKEKVIQVIMMDKRFPSVFSKSEISGYVIFWATDLKLFDEFGEVDCVKSISGGVRAEFNAKQGVQKNN